MKKQIQKSIDIKAGTQKVWDVLINDKLNRIWYAEFSEGTHAETDWKVGSKAIFTDNTKSGLISKVIANKPNETLSVEYIGIVNEGIEDYESDFAKQVKDGKETYRLSSNNDTTHLDIACDMSDEMFESMSKSWDKALEKIKALAEDAK